MRKLVNNASKEENTSVEMEEKFQSLLEKGNKMIISNQEKKTKTKNIQPQGNEHNHGEL